MRALNESWFLKCAVDRNAVDMLYLETKLRAHREHASVARNILVFAKVYNLYGEHVAKSWIIMPTPNWTHDRLDAILKRDTDLVLQLSPEQWKQQKIRKESSDPLACMSVCLCVCVYVCMCVGGV